MALEGKLTRAMLREIRMAKKTAGDDWSTTMFRENLKIILDEELEISDVLKRSKPTPDKNKEGPAKKSPGPNSPTVSCGTVEDKKKGEQVQQGKGQPQQQEKGRKPPPYNCYFCNQQHWANQCEQYRTIGEREKRLHQLGRCIRCFKEGHAAMECPRPSTCVNCRGMHPLAFCPNSRGSTPGSSKQPRKGNRGPTSGSNSAPIQPAKQTNEKVNAAALTSAFRHRVSATFCYDAARLFCPTRKIRESRFQRRCLSTAGVK